MLCIVNLTLLIFLKFLVSFSRVLKFVFLTAFKALTDHFEAFFFFNFWCFQSILGLFSPLLIYDPSGASIECTHSQHILSPSASHSAYLSQAPVNSGDCSAPISLMVVLFLPHGALPYTSTGNIQPKTQEDPYADFCSPFSE